MVNDLLAMRVDLGGLGRLCRARGLGELDFLTTIELRTDRRQPAVLKKL